jgi:hypothetical protein
MIRRCTKRLAMVVHKVIVRGSELGRDEEAEVFRHIRRRRIFATLTSVTSTFRIGTRSPGARDRERRPSTAQ